MNKSRTVYYSTHQLGRQLGLGLVNLWTNNAQKSRYCHYMGRPMLAGIHN